MTTTGFPTPALSETGSLPAGVTFTDNGNGTGTLQGTASLRRENFNISFTAQNGVSPNAVQNFTLTVAQVSAMAAARFLEQSSWGPTPATIAQVQQAGLAGILAATIQRTHFNLPNPAFWADSASFNSSSSSMQCRDKTSFASEFLSRSRKSWWSQLLKGRYPLRLLSLDEHAAERCFRQLL